MIKDILSKYDAVKNRYDCNIDSVESGKKYAALRKKWKNHIEKGWYGFDLGLVPCVWYDIIDEALEYIKDMNENFKIHQIKLKFGGCRVYVSVYNMATDDETAKINNLHKEIDLLEETLFDEKLIY